MSKIIQTKPLATLQYR